MLVPDAPLVRPVNEFITPVAADATAEPYMKQTKEEQKQTQVDLFDLFGNTPEANAVIFNLDDAHDDEDDAQVEQKVAMPEMTFKLADPEVFMEQGETIVTFEAPTPQETIMAEAEPTVAPNADENKTDESIEEQLRKSRERIMRLKDLSMKLRTGNIQELENVPAYKRKEIALQQTPASDESQVSRFSLLPDDEGKIEIRNNNSFLHDNVD